MAPSARWLQDCFLLTPEQWQKIWDYQKGRCALCGEPLGTCVLTDHDHKTGLVRGLLCFRCNKSMGEDVTVKFLRSALEFVLNPPASAALGGPHYGLPGRVGTKKMRALARKIREGKIRAPIRTPLGEQNDS